MKANNIEIENIEIENQINNEENQIINEENDIKSKRKVYNLTYYNKHRSSILEKLKEPKTCNKCMSLVQLSNFSRHTKRCLKLKTVCNSTSTTV